ncbi:hypothetical protein [Kineococcus sp. SYSU DK003]|uniref:hypothetical protein n=1 Tax=Kineococcus sp. SYSU DK003 TaxID=3383124 RepID=UPI003D7D7E82
MDTAADQSLPFEGAPPSPVWHAAPADVLPGIALVLGRSSSTVVTLSLVRAFATGLSLTLTVHARGQARRGNLFAEVGEGPYEHAQDEEWEEGRFRWGLELPDGRQVSNLDPPVLTTGAASGLGDTWLELEYWLWPLPPTGRLRLRCQWLDQGIEASVHELDAAPLLQAAARAQPLWPTD